MKQGVFALVATGLAGCTTMSGEVPPEQGDTAMLCKAEPAQAYVGKRADAPTGAAILKASGARTLRWGPPNAAWTMDYRQDRVNVQYDAAMMIERITCG